MPDHCVIRALRSHALSDRLFVSSVPVLLQTACSGCFPQRDRFIPSKIQTTSHPPTNPPPNPSVTLLPLIWPWPSLTQLSAWTQRPRAAHHVTRKLGSHEHRSKRAHQSTQRLTGFMLDPIGHAKSACSPAHVRVAYGNQRNDDDAAQTLNAERTKSKSPSHRQCEKQTRIARSAPRTRRSGRGAH